MLCLIRVLSSRPLIMLDGFLPIVIPEMLNKTFLKQNFAVIKRKRSIYKPINSYSVLKNVKKQVEITFYAFSG